MAFLQTFVNVVMIVVLAVPGFLLRKTKLLPDKATGMLAVLLLYVSQPFLMMSSLFNKEFETSMLIDFLWVIVFAAGLQLLVYIAAKFIFCKTKGEAARRACVASSYLGNVGFMGIPVMQMLFPGNTDMILYTVVYNIVFNAMTWTLGVFAITGDKKKVRPLKIILNPPTIAVIVALPFFFLNVHIPEQVMTPISYLGEMTLPLSMIILGVRLADMRLFGAKRPAVESAAETALSPVIGEGKAQPAASLAGASCEEIYDEEPVLPVSDEEFAPPVSVEEDAVTSAPQSVSARENTPKTGILDSPKVYLVAAVKLLLSPLLSLGVMLLVGLLFPIERFVIIALFIIAAMPTASSALNFAEMYGGDKETAAAATLMNTILCILSIPVLMMLIEFI